MDTVRSLIDHWAGERPREPFLLAPEPGAALDFAGLRAAALEIGTRLAALGQARGAKVAFLLDNGLWSASLFLGVMYGGRVVVPLNALAGPEQLRYVLEHCDAEVLFASVRHRERLDRVLDGFPRALTVIPTDEDTGPEWPARPPGGPVSAALYPVEPDTEALLIYTSGTTGRPKGALLSHGNAVAGGRNTAGAHGLGAADRALCVLPLYHINGEMVTVMGPLASGGSVVMPHRFSARRFWGLVAEHRCTWFSVVPTIISYLLEQQERGSEGAADPAKLRHVRFGRSASAPLAPSVHRAFEEVFGIPMVETMGLTETAAQILSNPMPPAKGKYGSPGLPFGNEARVIGKDGKALPDGESGELLIRGPNVLAGYYKDPEATAAALDADGWFHTGDLARRDADGYFFITGRLKELIIKGGENVSPREIDEALYRHPAVLEAAAFGVPDRHYGQEIMACVSLKPGTECSPDELRAFCEDQLGVYKTPKSVRILDELPKGPSGKIQRLRLVELCRPAAATRT